MDESQVWFKCSNYSSELWCPILSFVPLSVWRSYESWHSNTEPFMEARLGAHMSSSPHTPAELTTWKHCSALKSVSLWCTFPYITQLSHFVETRKSFSFELYVNTKKWHTVWCIMFISLCLKRWGTYRIQCNQTQGLAFPFFYHIVSSTSIIHTV